MPELRVGDFLTRRKEVVHIQDDERYRQVTISLNHGGVRLRGVKRGAEIGTKRQYLTRGGDFILSRIDARNAAFGIVPADLDGAAITNDFWSFEIDREQVDLDYFYLLSQTDAFLDACIRSSTGTTNRQRIQEGFFLDYTFEIPPLAEQTAAVARYQSMRRPLETVRTRLDAQLADLDALRQRVLDDAVRGRLTERGPDEVAEVPLGELVSVTGGGTPAKSNPAFWTGGTIPWVTPKDMKVWEIEDAQDVVTPLAVAESSAKMIDPGALLVVVRGMILSHTVPVAQLNAPATINQDMKALRPDDRVSPAYLLRVLWGMNAEILDRVATSTHGTKRLPTDQLLSVPVPVPPRAEQQRIVERVDHLLGLCDQLGVRLAAARADAERLTQTVLADALSA